MRIPQKTAVGFLVALLFALGFAASWLHALAQVVAAEERVGEDYARRLVALKDLHIAFERKVASSRGLLLTGNEIFLERVERARRDFGLRVEELRALITSERGRRMLEVIVDRAAAHQRALDELVSRRTAADLSTLAREFETHLVPRRERVEGSISALEAHQEHLLDQARQDARVETDRAMRLVWSTGGLLLVAVIVSAAAVVRAQRREEARRRRHDEAQDAVVSEATDAARAQEEFIAVATHDLKSPLHAMQLQIDTLVRCVRRAPDGDLLRQTEEGLQRMQRQVRRMTDLISYLLDVSRLARGGRLHLALEDVDLAGVARDVVDRMRDKIEESGSTIAVDATLPVVGWWDSFRLDQIVTNLVDNAVKYGAGRPIEVTVEALSRDVARLVVRDRGIGIDRDKRAHIFERFVRATHEAKDKSFGLGLWIVSRIVVAMGGTVSVDSAPGEGSTFTVELPRDGRSRRPAVTER